MKKSFETILYSALGVAALFLVTVAFNFLAGKVHKRIDLTADKAFTLSAGTRAILGKLDTPVKIRFYCTRNENMPPQLKLYAQEVEDLLDEYRQASKGLVQIQKLDPEPDSDAEDSARLDGVDGQPVSDGEVLFLGLSVSMLDQKEAIPFLSPDRERLLEYDISRAISRVTSTRKPVVGLMSPLQVAGDPMAAAMGRDSSPAWGFYSELERDYTVKQVDMNAAMIPGDVDVLVLIHPRGITDAGEYAIDQFVLRGGKLLAFLDPCAVLDAPPGGMPESSSSSSMPALLKAWGVDFDSGKILVDMTNIARTQRGRMPGLMALNTDAISKDDLVTADVTDLVMIFSGAFTGTPAAGLKETILVKSSKDSQFANPITAETTPDEVINHFVPANKEFPLAIRLSGKFKTAFPDGPPKESADSKDEAVKKDDKTAATPAALKESAQENTVILVGDSDMLQDEFAVQEQENPLGGKIVMPANGNLAFAENAVEQLTGDSNLIAIRSRTVRERPFTVVEKMEETAEASYRNKITELQSSLSDTEAKLNELQQHRAAPDEKNAQEFILSPEQQTEVENFRKTEASVKKELRDVRRNLRSETDSLENRIKWINIAGMPVLVAAAGIALAVFKRKRTAAQ